MTDDSRADLDANGAAGAGRASVVITVVRSGGIAGASRRWIATPAAEETRRWIDIIDACPWDDLPADDARGRDRFQWSITANARDEQREAVIPDRELAGPWRAVVDAVQAESRCVTSPKRPAHDR